MLGIVLAAACAKGTDPGDPVEGSADAQDDPWQEPDGGQDVTTSTESGPDAGQDVTTSDVLLDPVSESAAEAGPCTQCGSAGCGECPTVATISMGGARIDSIEVTNADYAAWLATSPKVGSQPASCAANTSFTPTQGWPAANSNHPVSFIDWCDARAYCTWAKKRLCGKLAGGENAYGDYKDATKSQWFKACTGGGVKTYPYGSTYEPSYCNGADFGKGDKTTAGEAGGCQGAYPGLFDMSGNVWEWEDSCDASNACRIRGGSYENPSNLLDCGVDSSMPRTTTAASIGFRCCSD